MVLKPSRLMFLQRFLLITRELFAILLSILSISTDWTLRLLSSGLTSFEADMSYKVSLKSPF